MLFANRAAGINFTNFTRAAANFLAGWADFFLNTEQNLLDMDASQLTRKRVQAGNFYRSNWQPRDASEVTNRNNQMSQKDNSSTHRGPTPVCCTGGTLPVNRSTSPTNGYSTTYSQEIVFQKKAGCAQCNDPNFGAPGGVQILSCGELATILANDPNPVKGQEKCCASPGINGQPGVWDAKYMRPSYTGWRGQTPAPAEGTLPSRQFPNFSSG